MKGIKTMNIKMKRFISLILCIAAVMLCAVSCGKGNDAPTDTQKPGDTSPVTVEMSVRDFGTMKLELYPDIAPETVENFVGLVKDGFYDGLTFHRIIKGFMIQGGDPDGNGTGGSGKTIKGEFSENGFNNTLSHDRGVISMARSSDPDSASSQFFICDTGDNKASLDGKYAAFGKVVEGLDVLDAVASVECVTSSYGERSVPVKTVYIDYIKVVD